MTKEVKRLSITPNVIKTLFAYSGNQCAMPDCKEALVDKSGTLLGKIAHICAAERGGLRFDPTMTNEERRSITNLMIVCGKHHDIIDDRRNLSKFPAEALQRFKGEHEARFKSAERQLIAQFVDSTQASNPKYPTNLRRLAKAIQNPELARDADTINGLREFIENLKELPVEQRAFAAKLAERMRRNKCDRLPVEDVEGAFNITSTTLRRHMKVLDHRGLGSLDETFQYEHYVVSLTDLKSGGNPWDQMLAFCEATGHLMDEFIFDLNFTLYDA